MSKVDRGSAGGVKYPMGKPSHCDTHGDEQNWSILGSESSDDETCISMVHRDGKEPCPLDMEKQWQEIVRGIGRFIHGETDSVCITLLAYERTELTEMCREVDATLLCNSVTWSEEREDFVDGYVMYSVTYEAYR